MKQKTPRLEGLNHQFVMFCITSSQEEPLQAQLPAAEFAVAADKPRGQVPSLSLPLLSS